MRVHVLASRGRSRQPGSLVPELVATLHERGVRVTESDPDEGVTPLGAEQALGCDLVVLKSGTEAALSWAGALAAAGQRVVNPHPVAAACRDKVVQTSVLLRAGVPVPQSWMTTDPRGVADHLADGPLVLKDPRGSRGRGVHVVTRADELASLERPRTWLVMRYHPPVGPDLKLYRIGSEVFGVARPFPARTLAEKLGRPAVVDPELRDLVLRCGEAFGIEVYGVDVIWSAGRRWVVDMSAFPGFKGVPEAGRRIGVHLVDRVLEAAPVATPAGAAVVGGASP